MSKVKKKKVSNKFDTDVVSNSVVSKYGDVVSTGTDVLETINSLEVIGVSPALDIALGGGLREGSVVVMTGDPKSGKTTTALHFAAKCQAKGKRVIYLNTEGRLSKQNFDGIKGLDPEGILIVQSTDDKILSAEDFLNIVEYYINNDPGCLIITDSLSNMVPQVELDGEVRTGVQRTAKTSFYVLQAYQRYTYEKQNNSSLYYSQYCKHWWITICASKNGRLW